MRLQTCSPVELNSKGGIVTKKELSFSLRTQTFFIRVPETMPLYDILNDFQKGHSHMAVVVREKEDPEKSISRNQLEGKHFPSVIYLP